jgi:Domain of unknown function (DUF5063)
MSRLSFKVRLRHLPTELGGRTRPILSDYRPSWDLKSRWHGQPTTNDGRVLLDGIAELAPGAEGPAFIAPLAEDFWGDVDVGDVLAMREGSRVVGYAMVAEVTRPEHFTRETAAFAHQAHQFCDFIERASSFPLYERLMAAQRRLLDLYSAGCALPRVAPPEGFDAGPSTCRPDGWAGFDRFEVYLEVFDPYVDEPPVAGELSDDVLDVYFDVKRGLELWRSKAPRSAAIWEWRFHFDGHWGDHAVDALRALHRACRNASHELRGGAQ